MIERLPLSNEAAARYLAIAPSADDAYFRRWLSSESPFLAYGEAELLFEGHTGALLVSRNPLVTGETFAAFAGLRLADPSAEQTAVRLLAEARRWAQERDLAFLRGPLAFSTWHPYRVLDEDHGQVDFPFPGETVEPASFGRYYQAAGLSVTDRYLSRVVYDGAPPWHLLPTDRKARTELRELSRSEFASELPAIHRMVSDTFAQNAFYAPIGLAEFAELLGATTPGTEPLMLGAFHDGVLVGFCVGSGYKDAEGRPVAILKTLGVIPELRGSRVARSLVFGYHRALHERGYRLCVHAMMKDDNNSQSMSAKYATPVRYYALYGAPLA